MVSTFMVSTFIHTNTAGTFCLCFIPDAFVMSNVMTSLMADPCAVMAYTPHVLTITATFKAHTVPIMCTITSEMRETSNDMQHFRFHSPAYIRNHNPNHNPKPHGTTFPKVCQVNILGKYPCIYPGDIPADILAISSWNILLIILAQSWVNSWRTFSGELPVIIPPHFIRLC